MESELDMLVQCAGCVCEVVQNGQALVLLSMLSFVAVQLGGACGEAPRRGEMALTTFVGATIAPRQCLTCCLDVQTLWNGDD